MNKDKLTEKLVGKNLLNEFIFLDEVDSTNKYAKDNYHNLPDNTLILASYQTKGKGRFDRIWESGKNDNLTFTILKKFEIDIDKLHLVNFYTSYILFLTLNKTLSEINDLTPVLKWPNDILLNRKKIAGILLEIKNMNSENKLFIIGVGLNVNQENFSDNVNSNATSLKKETGIIPDKEKILEDFIYRFYDNTYLISDSSRLLELWKSNSLIGENPIYFRQYSDDAERKGTAVNIDNDGGLVIRFEDGSLKKYFSGEIRIML